MSTASGLTALTGGTGYIGGRLLPLLEGRGGRFAVIRFSGRIESDSFAKAEIELRTWMNDKGLIGNGDGEFAGYDPPWTPGPFRHNEVLIRLESEDQFDVSH